jgi:hypothetical protein
VKVLTEREKAELKTFVTDVLTREYKFKKADARNMVNKSLFARLLNDDPEYVCHYDMRDWATRVKEEAQNATQRASG